MTVTSLKHPAVLQGGGDLPRLTSLRGFAALAVFFYHLAKDTPWHLGSSVVRHGFVGVGFFFILSGFVLTWSTRPTITPVDFYVRRIARIYPSHLVMAVVALLVPVTAFAPSWPGLAANLTLTQAWFLDGSIVYGINGVSWSLSVEFFFYAVTPFVLPWLHRRSTRTVVISLGSWFLAMSLVAKLAATVPGPVNPYTNPVIRSGEFALGMACAMLALRGRMPRIPLWVAGSVLALVLAASAVRPLRSAAVSDIVFALPSVLLIVAAAGSDLAGAGGVLQRRLLVYAGQVSFAFYLVHELVLFNGAQLIGERVGTSLPERIGAAVMLFAAAAGLAVLLHEMVEKPLQKRIRAVYRIRQTASRPA